MASRLEKHRMLDVAAYGGARLKRKQTFGRLGERGRP
jgi:hypothetical protein